MREVAGRRRQPIAILMVLVLVLTSLFTENAVQVRAADEETIWATGNLGEVVSITGTEYRLNDENSNVLLTVKREPNKIGETDKGLGKIGNGISSNAWDASGEEYWQLEFSTLGYENLKLKFKSSSSGTGPRDFEVRYSTDGESYTKLVNSEYTNNTSSSYKGVDNEFVLTDSMSNKDKVYIRIVHTGTEQVNSSSDEIKMVQSGGTSQLNFITLMGTPIAAGPVDPPIESSTPTVGATEASVASGAEIEAATSITLTAGALSVSGAAISMPASASSIHYSINDGADTLYTAPISMESYKGSTVKLDAFTSYTYDGNTYNGASTSYTYTVKAAGKPVSDIATVKAIKDEAEKDKAYTIQGTVIYIQGKNVYVQDSTYGIDLYMNDTAADDSGKLYTTISVGDVIKATGQFAVYNGLYELKNVATYETISYANKAGEPVVLPEVEVTVEAILADNSAGTDSDAAKKYYQCTRVKLVNAVLGTVNSEGITSLTQSGAGIDIFKGSMEAELSNNVVDMTAVVGSYNGKAQLYVTSNETQNVTFSAPVTIAEARAATGEELIVQGTVVFIDGKNVVIQEGDTGINLYFSSDRSSELKLGDIIRAKGDRAVYKLLAQLKNVTDYIVINHTDTLPYKDVTIKDIISDASTTEIPGSDEYQSTRVRISAVSYGAINGNNTLLTQEGSSINIFKAPGLTGINTGDTIDLYAVVGTFNGVQLRVAAAEDISLSSTGGGDIDEPIDPEDPDEPEISTIAEFKAAKDTDNAMTVEGIITFIDGRNVYIQDGTAGVDAYFPSNGVGADAVIGANIRVTGKYAIYKGLIELVPDPVNTPEFYKCVSTGNELPHEVVTIAALLDDFGSNKYQGRRVLISRAVLGTVNTSGNTTLTQNGRSINIYKIPADIAYKEGDSVDVYAVVGAYNSIQLRVAAAKDIKAGGAAGAVTVDTSVILPLVSWDGYGVEYTSTPIYGDLNSANDMLDTSAELTLSTNIIPLYKINEERMIGSTGLAAGQYYQMSFPTKGYGNLTMDFTMRGSNKGAGKFNILYSRDGLNFEKLTGINYDISYYDSTINEMKTKTYVDVDFIKVEKAAHDYRVTFPDTIADADKVYIRMQVTDDNESINGETIGATGVNRFLNIAFTASPVVSDDICDIVSVTPEEGYIELDSELILTCLTEGAELYYSIDGGEYMLYNAAAKPVISKLPATVTTYARYEGRKDSVKVTYGYKQIQVSPVKISPNGGAVNSAAGISLSCATEGATIYYSIGDISNGDGYMIYDGSFKLSSFPSTVKAYAVKKGCINSQTVTASFTERENEEYNIYFGQIHSHTEYSDGAGTAAQAYEYASNKAENLDFLAVTDHSNSFDNDVAATINDGSVSSEWIEGHKLADDVTEANTITDADGNEVTTFVGLYGYEMTWSGGAPGHINTYNTDGFMSRNMDGYASQQRSSLQNYYATLKTVTESISMFNHPGNTFGDFYDFAYYDEDIDRLITLIEVGNGEGAIGSSGYFPSYEYYTRALDKGWHVAPTNNQDNHKGLWGDSNTGRTVILADTLSEESIYDALRNMRAYATEDADQKIWYKLNGFDMGYIYDENTAPDKVEIEVKIEDDTDSADSKIEVIVNGGIPAAQTTMSEANGTVEFELEPDYSYYYIRVTQADGDIAVTAPVWISKVEAIGVASLTTNTTLQVAGEPIDVNMTLFNNEAESFAVDSIVYTIDGEVIYESDMSSNGLAVIEPSSEASESFIYTHGKSGAADIKVSVYGRHKGISKVYSQTLSLTFIPESMVTRVVVDGTHNNDYVTGYYEGNVGNFADIAAEEYVQVNVVKDTITAELLEDCQLLIISATNTYYKSEKEYIPFEDEFIKIVCDYAANGGNIVFCGIADYNDSARGSSSEDINKLLAAVGATSRLNSDEMVDDVENGGQIYRLYFNDFNMTSKYLAGVTPAQTYSAYSACSVLLDEAAVAEGKAEALVYGHDTTYSINSKALDDNYVEVPKGSLVAMAHEKLPGGSNIFVAGTVFLSDFEIKNELDNAGDSYYANRNILLNILSESQIELPVSDIAELRKSEIGKVFTIEGYVTAGTAAAGNIFFDTIYVQDDTAGTTVFPIADAGIEVGTKLKITGFVDEYQGDKEIQILKYTVLDDPKVIKEPSSVNTGAAADYDKLGGSLLKISGRVTGIVTGDSGVNYIYVNDGSGVAKVFFDGYILSSNGTDISSRIRIDDYISAVGLSYMNPDGACLRVRDRAEIVITGRYEPVIVELPEEEIEIEDIETPAGSTKPPVIVKKVTELYNNREFMNDIMDLFDENTFPMPLLVEVNKEGTLSAPETVTLNIKNKMSSKKAGDTVYVYRYDKETGWFYELPNTEQTVLEGRSIAFDVISGGDYIALDYQLPDTATVTLKEQTRAYIAGKNVLHLDGTGYASKMIKIILPDTLVKSNDLDTELESKAQMVLAITYKSEDKNVATVSRKGRVTAKGKGKTVITVTIKYGNGDEKIIKTKITVK